MNQSVRDLTTGSGIVQMNGHSADQRSTLIKFCGLTRAADAAVAERAGASYLGVILASGPRLLSPQQAGEVLGSPRASVQRVAVFGNQSTSEILDVAAELRLDVVQLHGDPTVAQIDALRRVTHATIWPVLRVQGTSLPAEAEALAHAANALVLDAKVVGQLGGTGVALDWAGLRRAVETLRERVPSVRLVVAGGLRADNVHHAIALLEPDVVDVSSGVEFAPGVKDPTAIEQFVSAVSTAKGKKA